MVFIAMVPFWAPRKHLQYGLQPAGRSADACDVEADTHRGSLNLAARVASDVTSISSAIR